MSYHSLIRTNPTGLYLFDPPVDLSKKQAGGLSLTNTIFLTNSFNSGKVVLCPPSFTIPLHISEDAWAIGVSAKGAGTVWKFPNAELSIVDGKVNFTCTQPDKDVTATAKAPKTMSNFFCVKDPDSIMLYIDGELAASSELDGPVATANTLTVGGTSKVFISNLITYDNAMSADKIAEIDAGMRRYPYRQTLFETVGSSLFTPELVSTSHHSRYLGAGFSSGHIMETGPGSFESIEVFGDTMNTIYIQPGTSAVALYWDDKNDVELSVNLDSNPGGGGIVPQNGVPIIGPDYENGDGMTIVATMQSIGSNISGFRLVEFNDNELRPHGYGIRRAVMSGEVYVPHTSHHLQLHGDGIRFINDGILELLPDESDPVEDVKTLELVFSITEDDLAGTRHIMNSAPEHSSNIMVSSGKLAYAGFTGVYLNGQQVSSASASLEPGVSYHLIANYTAAHNAKITFGREGYSFSGAISTIGLHKEGFNAAQALARFKLNLTYPTQSVTDSDKIGVSDPDLSTFMYDWTTSGA